MTDSYAKLLETLDVRPDMRVDVLELEEPGLLEVLEEHGIDFSLRPRPQAHRVILGVRDSTDLAALRILARTLHPSGAVWVILPNSPGAPGEDLVREAAGDAGLVAREAVSFESALVTVKLTLPAADD